MASDDGRVLARELVDFGIREALGHTPEVPAEGLEHRRAAPAWRRSTRPAAAGIRHRALDDVDAGIAYHPRQHLPLRLVHVAPRRTVAPSRRASLGP